MEMGKGLWLLILYYGNVAVSMQPIVQLCVIDVVIPNKNLIFLSLRILDNLVKAYLNPRPVRWIARSIYY